MEQCDFMNPDFELIEHTDLDDEDLYKAVDVILAQSQSTETPDSSAANGALSTEPVHFEEPPLNPSRFLPHILQLISSSNSSKMHTQNAKHRVI